MSAKYANFMSQRSSHNLSPKAKSSSIRKNLTSGFISKSRVKVVPRESHLTSVWRSKDVCRLAMSSHNILNSLVFLGRDLIKLFSHFHPRLLLGKAAFFFPSKGMAVEDAVATAALLDFLFYSWDNTGRLSSHGLRTVCAHINAVIPWDAAHCENFIY